MRRGAARGLTPAPVSQWRALNIVRSNSVMLSKRAYGHQLRNNLAKHQRVQPARTRGSAKADAAVAAKHAAMGTLAGAHAAQPTRQAWLVLMLPPPTCGCVQDLAVLQGLEAQRLYLFPRQLRHACAQQRLRHRLARPLQLQLTAVAAHCRWEGSGVQEGAERPRFSEVWGTGCSAQPLPPPYLPAPQDATRKQDRLVPSRRHSLAVAVKAPSLTVVREEREEWRAGWEEQQN